MKSLNLSSIRLQNVYRIFDIIQKNPGITRKEIAQIAGLSLMTVSNLVDFLEKNKAIHISQNKEIKRLDSRVGRIADTTSLDENNYVWFFIDLTERFFSLQGFNLNVKPVIEPLRHDYNTTYSYADNLLAFLSAAKDVVEEAQRARTVIGFIVSVPGPFNANEDTVVNMRIPELNNLHIKTVLAQHLGDYYYYVDEDVKLSIRAFLPLEWTAETAVRYYLYIGVGVGGAALVGNQVLKGLNSVAGDIGQVPSRNNNETFEQRVSLRSFVARLGESNEKADQGLSQQELLDIVRDYSENHHSEYRKALDEMISEIGDMLTVIAWMLSPETIYIDCKYAQWADQDFINDLNTKLRKTINGQLTAVPKCELVSSNLTPVIIGSYQTIIYGWLKNIV